MLKIVYPCTWSRHYVYRQSCRRNGIWAMPMHSLYALMESSHRLHHIWQKKWIHHSHEDVNNRDRFARYGCIIKKKKGMTIFPCQRRKSDAGCGVAISPDKIAVALAINSHRPIFERWRETFEEKINLKKESLLYIETFEGRRFRQQREAVAAAWRSQKGNFEGHQPRSTLFSRTLLWRSNSSSRRWLYGHLKNSFHSYYVNAFAAPWNAPILHFTKKHLCIGSS